MKLAWHVALLPFLACFPAHAQEYEHGNALLCDNQRQVERYVELFKGEDQSAVDAVNAEERDPTACAFATVAFVRGPQLETARNKDNAFQVVRVLVLGVETPNGLQPVKPSAYFSAFEVLEYDV